MPSPDTIPSRLISSSDPDEALIPRQYSSRSSASSSRTPARFSYWTSWSNINKLGDYIIPGRKSNESSRHSDLTEESLHAHNKLHGTLSHKAHISNYIITSSLDDKNNHCSPYYNGLVDSTLSINRERNLPGAESPGPESISTTVASPTPSYISSFFVKVQEYGSSCFTSRRTGNKDYSAAAARQLIEETSSSVCAKSTFPVEIKEEKKQTHEYVPPDAQILVDKEKPLRERVSEPSAASPSLPTTIFRKKTVVSNNVEKKLEPNIQMEYQKFILADKYRPKALKDFICNRSEALRLQNLVKLGENGHFIFEGLPGVGKRTMIWAMLREAFESDSVQTRDQCKGFELKGESVGRIEVNVKESSKHVEVNLSDLRGYEKHVIMELMKETQNHTAQSNKVLSFNPDNCKVIVLCEADKLSTDTLLYIRWLLERYKGCSSFFFCCSDASKLQPIRPLCTLVELRPPSEEEIVEVLEFIAKQEGIFLPHKLAVEMANSSKNNLRQAIRSLEACWHSSYPFREDQVVLTGWEGDIANIAKNIVEERSPKQLYIIRGKLQILIEHNVCPLFIFKTLVEELKKHLQHNLHYQIDGLFDEYSRDESMIGSEDETGIEDVDPAKISNRAFSRIEEFIARFMSWYNNQSRLGNAGNTPLAC